MAHEVVREALGALPADASVLDPMCGSGTVLHEAVSRGLSCVGYDIDPLAVIMSRAWTSATPPYRLLHDAHVVLERAMALSSDTEARWASEATAAFAEYWFADNQHVNLTRLAMAIESCRFQSKDLLRVSFSRLIVTKDHGASLARDVSHSRPHRVADTNDFDVFGMFLRSARTVAARLTPNMTGHAAVSIGDARLLEEQGAYDIAVSSPPYLNAIDYMRGHRLALIWFGYSVEELRQIRATSIGTESSATGAPLEVMRFVDHGGSSAFGRRHVGWLNRYATDMDALAQSLRRAVKVGGRVLLVVGNSNIRGAAINNAGIVAAAAAQAGFSLTRKWDRDIPANRRYLPAPATGQLSLRMRSETVLDFAA